MSRVFGAAQRFLGLADSESDLVRFGSVPADLVNTATITKKPLDQVQFERIQVHLMA
jgi:hypothetical protein